MKRLLLALSAAALIASAVLLPSTAASGGLIEAIDVGVETSSLLPQISPAGNYGVFTVTATLSGPTAATVYITDNVGGGTIDPAESVLGACEGTEQLSSSGELTCRISLTPAAPSATIHVAVRSGLTATQVFNQATVSMQGSGDDTIVGVDANDSNNQDSASTPVVNGTTTTVGFLPEGQSMRYESNGQTHVLTVTQAKGPGGGALVSMSDPGQMNCGADPCNGVRIWFDQGQDGGFYEAATQLDSSGTHDPCRGLGNSCTAIFWRKLPTDTMVPEPLCGSEGPAEPCLRSKYKTDGGLIHYLSELDTDDPDIGIPGIPTLGSGK